MHPFGEGPRSQAVCGKRAGGSLRSPCPLGPGEFPGSPGIPRLALSAPARSLFSESEMKRDGRGRKGTAGTMLLMGREEKMEILRVEAPLEGESLREAGLSKFDALLEELRAPVPPGRTPLQLAFYAHYSPLDQSAAEGALAGSLVEDLEALLEESADERSEPYGLLAYL